MTPEQRKIKGADAKALLDNRLFKEAFASLAEYLDQQALACDPDNKDKAQRIVISRQILAGVKREITRLVEDGAVADIQLQELEKAKRFRFFQR